MKRGRERIASVGFTLIEMVAVVAIVGVLAVAALPMRELVARRSQELALRASLRSLRDAIDAHKKAADDGLIAKPADASGYPPTLQTLVDGVPEVRAGSGRRLYFLRRLPRDPTADPALAAAETWALRSHESPPQAPAPGRDVFDVASRSERTALDGSRYDAW